MTFEFQIIIHAEKVNDVWITCSKDAVHEQEGPNYWAAQHAMLDDLREQGMMVEVLCSTKLKEKEGATQTD